MANQPLLKLYFPIFDRKTGAGRSLENVLGVFSCRANVAKFLDVDTKAISGVIVKERKSHTRSLLLVGGVTLTQTPAGAEIAASEIVLPIGSKGSRSVILKTGVAIGSTGRFHTVSFRFPGWTTIQGISDALGEIIPSGKIKNPPGASEVAGFFRVLGGRTYPITLESAAEGDQEVQVPESAAEIEALGAQAGIKKAKPAAGNA